MTFRTIFTILLIAIFGVAVAIFRQPPKSNTIVNPVSKPQTQISPVIDEGTPVDSEPEKVQQLEVHQGFIIKR